MELELIDNRGAERQKSADDWSAFSVRQRSHQRKQTTKMPFLKIIDVGGTVRRESACDLGWGKSSPSDLLTQGNVKLM